MKIVGSDFKPWKGYRVLDQLISSFELLIILVGFQTKLTSKFWIIRQILTAIWDVKTWAKRSHNERGNLQSEFKI